MRSLGSGRRSFELMLRILATGCLASLVIGAFVRRAEGRLRVMTGRELTAALWEQPVPRRSDSLHVEWERPPSARERDWVSALARSGRTVSWSLREAPAVALVAEPVPDPIGGAVARVAAPAGVTVRLGDDLGMTDTAHVSRVGVAFEVPMPIGTVRSLVDSLPVVVPAPDRLPPAEVVVLARAGWEAKFVIAALEERGWEVAARLEVAPGEAVVQGTPLPPDTARHAAVIVLDSISDAVARRIVGFVRGGGGLILGPDGARTRALRAIAPATVGGRVRSQGLAGDADTSRAALSRVTLERLRRDALSLEERDGATVVAARREGRGRVIQVGYEDTWRWRMTGVVGSVAAHREWWAHLASSAARRAFPSPSASASEGAPLAKLVSVLGPPASRSPRATAENRTWYPVALALFLLALMGEWVSRRLRGAA